jgi:ribA/ribD-fused uncharacterized protein
MKKKIVEFKGDFEFLSNFSLHSFKEPNGACWKTNEHFYQAAKTTHPVWRKKIYDAKTPALARELGQLAPTMGCKWERRQVPTMLQGLTLKFGQHEDIRKKLLSTTGYMLIEGNTWHDNFWGNCTCEKCKDIEGKNNLGGLLMILRENPNMLEIF